MFARVQKLWDEHCKPRAKVNFHLIDDEKEKAPEEPDTTIDINVYFVT